jgi:hypothetical protein
MNDEFLYQLRVQPPVSFAAKLKLRLDIQSADAKARRLAFKWYVLMGIVLGTSAMALMIPSVRTAIASLFSSTADPVTVTEMLPTIEVGSAGAAENQRTLAAPLSRLSDDQIASAADHSGHIAAEAKPRHQDAAPTSVHGPHRVVHVAMAQSAKDVADKMIASYEKTYGFEVRRKPDSEHACLRWPQPDVFVTLGQLDEGEGYVCQKAGVQFIEMPIAYEAYVAVANRENTWVESLTMDDLRTFGDRSSFDPNPLATWNQLRSNWPSLPISIVGLDSIHRSYGEKFVPARSVRGLPFNIGKSDSDVVATIESTYGGLGFMTFSTYRKQLEAGRGYFPVKVIAIVNELGDAILPSQESIQSGRYDTLSRPLLLHVSSRGLHRREVVLFGTHAVEGVSQQLGDFGFEGIDRRAMDTAARKLRAAGLR